MNKYYKKFYEQRYQAINKRNIEWDLTFEQWLNWWGEDIIDRGSGKGKLNMCRFNDTGPYSLENIYKGTHEDNIISAHTGMKRTPEHVAILTEQLKTARKPKAVITPLGKFNSIADAGRAHKIHCSTVTYHIKKENKGWYFA